MERQNALPFDNPLALELPLKSDMLEKSKIKGEQRMMSKREIEPNTPEQKSEHNVFDKYENPFLRKFEREKAEYLAGKPFRMRRGTLFSYVVSLVIIIGIPFGRAVYYGTRADIPLRETLLRWELLLLLGVFFSLPYQ